MVLVSFARLDSAGLRKVYLTGPGRPSSPSVPAPARRGFVARSEPPSCAVKEIEEPCGHRNGHRQSNNPGQHDAANHTVLEATQDDRQGTCGARPQGEPRASVSRTGSLLSPSTMKQKARRFKRWRGRFGKSKSPLHRAPP